MLSNAISRYDSDSGSNGRPKPTEYVLDTTTSTWAGKYSASPSRQPLPLSEENKEKEETYYESVIDPTPSQKEAEKEFIEIEFNTLTGDLSLRPSRKTMSLKVNKTVEIIGIGKYLSGQYFISSVKRSLNKDSGYSQSITVLKNGFGDSFKKSMVSTSDAVSKSPVQEPPTPREEITKVEVETPKYKAGDTVKITGNAVYSNAHEGVKVPAWVKTKTLTIKQVSSDGARVLLMPINSWTYVKYIQKA